MASATARPARASSPPESCARARAGAAAMPQRSSSASRPASTRSRAAEPLRERDVVLDRQVPDQVGLLVEHADAAARAARARSSSGRRESRSPATRTVPPSGSSSPARQASSVDLPEPDGGTVEGRRRAAVAALRGGAPPRPPVPAVQPGRAAARRGERRTRAALQRRPCPHHALLELTGMGHRARLSSRRELARAGLAVRSPTRRCCSPSHGRLDEGPQVIDLLQALGFGAARDAPPGDPAARREVRREHNRSCAARAPPEPWRGGAPADHDGVRAERRHLVGPSPARPDPSDGGPRRSPGPRLEITAGAPPHPSRWCSRLLTSDSTRTRPCGLDEATRAVVREARSAGWTSPT